MKQEFLVKIIKGKQISVLAFNTRSSFENSYKEYVTLAKINDILRYVRLTETSSTYLAEIFLNNNNI